MAMKTEQAQLGQNDGSLIAAPGPPALLLSDDGAAISLTTNPGGVVSSIVSVLDARYVTFWLKIAANAAGGYVHLFPFVSPNVVAPALGDDSWYGLGMVDLTSVDTLPSGTVPTGADYTFAPEWGVVKMRPTVIRSIDADNATDEIRMKTPRIDVADARWMYVACEEASAGTVSAVLAYWTKST